MALGLKTIETRSWKTDYRGPLLICSAKRPMGKTGWELWLKYSGEHVHMLFNAKDRSLYGKALCVVNFIDVQHTNPVHHIYMPRGTVDSAREYELGDYTSGRFAWTSDSLVRLHWPISVKGRQGLWSPSVGELQQVAEMLKKSK